MPVPPGPGSGLGSGSGSGDEHRSGVAAGIGAYGLWGVFPLVFHRLKGVGAGEILEHRIVWSLVVVSLLIAWRGPRGWVRPLLQDRRQVGRLLVALGFGAAAVVVLTVGFGRPPWIALVLAVTFAGYGFQKQAVRIPAAPSLAVETAFLAPFAVVALAVAEADGSAAFLHGSAGRDLLLAGLGIVTAAPLLMFATAARRIPLSTLGLLQYLTPTLQLVCGVAILGEDLRPERLAGLRARVGGARRACRRRRVVPAPSFRGR